MFERFVDMVMDRWTRHPGLHIYHYAPYEPGALKRLMGRYATREDEIDRMLRAGLFVDLYAVVRRSIRASVERYSIKDLEVFYGYEREIELRHASANLRAVEHALELELQGDITDEQKQSVLAYNRDDCASTLHLRNWLEQLRSELVAQGEMIDRPPVSAGEASEAVDERRRRALALMERLTEGMDPLRENRDAGDQARWLLAQMLEWHRREAKAPWWEYFRLAELPDEELLDEKAAVAGLTFADRVGGTAKCPVDSYEYMPQETQLDEDDDLYARGDVKIGKVAAVDVVARTIDIKKTAATKEQHPTSVFSHSIINTTVLAESLYRIGTWVADHGIDANGPYRSGRDLLIGVPPRLQEGSAGPELREGEDTLAAARRLASSLDGGVLAIQGPPGAGKTFTGARMICELVRRGKRVGITAVSHKVIRNLLDGVVEAAGEEGLSVACIEKVTGKVEKNQTGPIIQMNDNKKVLAALGDGDAQIVGGTAWLWAREDAAGAADVLFVDEAGQMSLTDVVAVSQGARSIVLLGDPQQLEQPIQGSHPDGTSVSALEHLLGGRKTIAPEQGLFLGQTWRLHPDICQFTSEAFYESRLGAQPALAQQELLGAGDLSGTGLRIVPVSHEGNQNTSPEEAAIVESLVGRLIGDGVTWIDHKGVSRPVGLRDILVVCPYNAQVSEVGRRVDGLRVGTVDKFQGQEAPVVIYSMATSTPEDAPRGMEFLYSLNRLNVATSRARCVCILVANPRLFEPECRTPRQIQLANAFCRYVELATTVSF